MNLDDFQDLIVKHAVIIMFMAVITGIFYSGYAAGTTGRWYYGIIVIILYPVLSKFWSA